MTDEQTKLKTDEKIERLYDRGLNLAIDATTPEEIETARLTFLAGMDIAVRATARAMDIQNREFLQTHEKTQHHD